MHRSTFQQYGLVATLVAWLRQRSPGQVLALVGAAGLLAAATGIVLASLTHDKWFDKLWFEVAKAGVQVIAVGVLGGALAAGWKNIAADREQERERQDKLRAELVDLFTQYNAIKSVRRGLRSHGLDLTWSKRIDTSSETESVSLTEAQVQVYREEMKTLNSLQLVIENKARQFGQTDLLETDNVAVVRLLDQIEAFLLDVLQDAWEIRGWTIDAGSDLRPISEALQPLFRQDSFRPGVTDRLNQITEIVNRHLFGPASPATKAAVEELREERKKREAEAEQPPQESTPVTTED